MNLMYVYFTTVKKKNIAYTKGKGQEEIPVKFFYLQTFIYTGWKHQVSGSENRPMICSHIGLGANSQQSTQWGPDVPCMYRDLKRSEELEAWTDLRAWTEVATHLFLPPWRWKKRPLLSNVNKSTLGRGKEGLWVFTTIQNVNSGSGFITFGKRENGSGEKESSLCLWSLSISVSQKGLGNAGTLRHPGRIASQQYP